MLADGWSRGQPCLYRPGDAASPPQWMHCSYPTQWWVHHTTAVVDLLTAVPK